MAIRFSRARLEDKTIQGLIQKKYDFDLSKQTKVEKAKLARKSQIGIKDDPFSELIETFISLQPNLIQTQYIVIEQQIPGATLNLEVMNKLIGVLGVLIRNQGNRPIIIEISPCRKSVPLGGVKSMPGRKAIKDWCYQRALVCLEQNGGEFDLQLLTEMKGLTKYGKNKRDDPADTICYCYAWWHHYIFNQKVTRESLTSQN